MHKLGSKIIKQGVFVAIVIVIIALIFASFSYMDELSANIMWILLLLVVLLALWHFDFLLMLKDFERAVVFRFGKVNRVGGPGWAVIIPPIESYTLVDLRTRTVDIPPQDVITKDNVELKIDSVIYIKVLKDDASVIKSVVEVENYKNAAKLYVVGLMRDIMGSMTVEEVVSGVEELNVKIKDGLKKISEGWGVTADAVEITDVNIPKAVLDAMHLQKAAEQEKLARLERAFAHKAEIDAVNEAAERLSDKALQYHYIRALEKMSEGKATKMLFPIEISQFAETIAGTIGGTAASAKPKEDLLKQYAPLIAEYLKAEKKERENKSTPKKGKK